MSAPHFAAELKSNLRQPVIIIDPANPEQSEIEIVERLEQIDAHQTAKTALLALGTLVLGLLILGPADKA